MSATAQQVQQNLQSTQPVAVASVQITNTLAVELATGLYPTAELLEKFNLTAVQFKKICADPHFKTMYAEAKALWSGSDNVKERIRQKACLLLEDSIIPLFSIIQNADIAPGARIDAFGKIMSVADMQPTKDGGVKGTGGGLTVNISMGQETQTVTIDSEPLVGDDDD